MALGMSCNATTSYATQYDPMQCQGILQQPIFFMTSYNILKKFNLKHFIRLPFSSEVFFNWKSETISGNNMSAFWKYFTKNRSKQESSYAARYNIRPILSSATREWAILKVIKIITLLVYRSKFLIEISQRGLRRSISQILLAI